MHAHANDLRDEIEQDWESLTGESKPPDSAGLDAFVHGVIDDRRSLPVTPALHQLLAWTVKLTRRPGECNSDDIEGLRAAGWSDAAIHDAAQVIAYFNYINRIADGLGVKEEPGMRLWGRAAGSGEFLRR